MQTQAEDRRSAEAEIFSLLKQIDKYAAVGDSDEVSRLQLEISRLQQKYGAVTGTRRKNDDRTA
jgi:hypothetical protein